ncbi:MAG: hypothetical protein C3F13_04030 [Anaerolineales bacterium]|nr:MAG: hypothetical protein C3F13_04030 [Anaerolineales bacterium]
MIPFRIPLAADCNDWVIQISTCDDWILNFNRLPTISRVNLPIRFQPVKPSVFERTLLQIPEPEAE